MVVGGVRLLCCRGIGATTRAYLGAIGAERGLGDDTPLLAHPRGLHLRRGGPPSPASLRNRDLEAAARVYRQREGRRSGRREFLRESCAIGGKEKVSNSAHVGTGEPRGVEHV